MNTLRTSSIHQAVVIDEYGSPQGIITLRDIVGDLVGNITESDLSARPTIRQLENGDYVVDGQYQIEDLWMNLKSVFLKKMKMRSTM
jgi:putative hemolysin